MASIGGIFAEQELRRESLADQAKREFAAVVAELQDQYKAERIQVARQDEWITSLAGENEKAHARYERLTQINDTNVRLYKAKIEQLTANLEHYHEKCRRLTNVLLNHDINPQEADL